MVLTRVRVVASICCFDLPFTFAPGFLWPGIPIPTLTRLWSVYLILYANPLLFYFSLFLSLSLPFSPRLTEAQYFSQRVGRVGEKGAGGIRVAAASQAHLLSQLIRRMSNTVEGRLRLATALSERFYPPPSLVGDITRPKGLGLYDGDEDDEDDEDHKPISGESHGESHGVHGEGDGEDEDGDDVRDGEGKDRADSSGSGSGGGGGGGGGVGGSVMVDGFDLEQLGSSKADYIVTMASEAADSLFPQYFNGGSDGSDGSGGSTHGNTAFSMLVSMADAVVEWLHKTEDLGGGDGPLAAWQVRNNLLTPL